jgi:glycerophosphoryl diester phosphodiesterase
MNVLIQPLVSHLRKRGIMTFYWVCNCEEDFKRAIKYGASGIMTDDPLLLDQYLEKIYQKEE